MRKILIVAFIVFTITGCVKEAEWKEQSEVSAFIVVDAILTDVAGQQTIQLKYPVNSLNEIPLPISGANVVITTVDSTYQLTESNVKGNYLTGEGFAAKQGQTYTLLIFSEGRSYTAKADMMAGINFDPLIYAKNDDNDQYHVIFVSSAFEPENPAMWEVLLNWSKVPSYEGADSSDTRARLLFYTLPTIDVTEIFAPEVEKISFPEGTIIVQKRYSLTPDHAEFIRELLSETNWQGGLFSTTPANISTNLSSGAIGYFAVCGVTSLSFTVAGKK